MPQALTPQEIRSIRGDRTQAEFAELLGVSPVSVYRWELEPGEGQSRSPRRAMQARIRSLGEPGEGPRSSSQAPRTSLASSRPERELSPDELERMLSILDRVFQARWRDAEDEVMPFLHSQDTCLPMRSFAQTIMAQVQLFERGDVRSALTSLQPALDADGAGRLPAWIAARVQVTAALVFAMPDGRVFHPGRVNLCANRAEELLGPSGSEELLGLVALARFVSAKCSGDAHLASQVMARSHPILAATQSPLLEVLRTELCGYASFLEGKLLRAREKLARAIELAELYGIPTSRFRASVKLAWLELFCGEPHEKVQGRVVQARRFADRARLTSDVAEATLEATSAELAFRRGDMQGAQAALERARRSQRARMLASPEALATAARVLVLRRDEEGFQALEDHIEWCQKGNAMAGEGALRLYFQGMKGLREGNFPAAARDLLAVEGDVREAGHPLWLGAFAAAVASYCALLCGDLETHSYALRKAEKAFERFPAAWLGAILASFQAMAAAAQGRSEDARLFMETAEATFERCGDRIQLAILERVRAVISLLAGDETAIEAMAASDQDLLAIGLPIPPALELHAVEELRSHLRQRESAPAPRLPARELLVPLNRLIQRGQGPRQVGEELTEAVAHLTGEDSVWVCEIDSTGETRPFTQRGSPPEGASPKDFFEFGDGCGRRFRLGVVGPVADPLRPVLQSLAQVAGLAMELGTLRLYRSSGEASPRAEDAPPILGMVAKSPAMRRVVEDLHRLRHSRATVLISGESGTGKEVVARALHDSSRRAEKAYVTFNCSTVPPDLFEGQLFGYRKGAFTGATQDYSGVIRSADGGTLFLDEIGDLPLELQPKLLRFLENSEVLPLGETKPLSVNVRVVAATHKDLAELVKQGEFREDLFFRLQVVPLHLPPLRERPEDVVPLVEHFLKSLVEEGEPPPRLDPEGIHLLQAYPWPGNAREVRNLVERITAFTPVPRVLGPPHLRLALPRQNGETPPASRGAKSS